MKRLAILGCAVLVLSGWPTRADAQDLPIRVQCSLASDVQVSSGGGCSVASADICCDTYIGPIYVESGCAYCHYGMCQEPAEVRMSCTELT